MSTWDGKINYRQATTDLLNIDVSVNLAFGGTLPIVLGLLILRVANKRDSYTVTITTCPFALLRLSGAFPEVS